GCRELRRGRSRYTVSRHHKAGKGRRQSNSRRPKGQGQSVPVGTAGPKSESIPEPVCPDGSDLPWRLPLASRVRVTSDPRRDRESAGTLAEALRPLTHCDFVSHDFLGHISVRWASSLRASDLLAPCTRHGQD